MFKTFSWTNMSFFFLWLHQSLISHMSVFWMSTCQSVCSWTDWLSYGQTVYMVGLLLGSLVGGAISDRYTLTHMHTVGGGALLTWSGFLCRYGKRPVLLACACVQAFCGLVPAMFPQPLLFLAIRCLTAVCCCCINICAFSLGNDHHSAASSSQTVQWLFSEEVLVHLQNKKKRQTLLRSVAPVEGYLVDGS